MGSFTSPAGERRSGKATNLSRPYAAIDRWYQDLAQKELGEKFDGYIGPHKHFILRQYPIFKSRGLSWPPPEKQP